MPTPQTERLEYESRYRDTAQVTLEGRRQWELWERPIELEEMLQYAFEYTVREHEIGRLDLLAYRFYNNVRLWWVIAAINNLVNCFDEMYPGQRIYIPNPAQMRALLSRSGTVIDENEA